MIKSELISRLTYKQSHFSEKDVSYGVNLILEYLSNALSNGRRIEIRDFGSFSLHYRRPRNAHNPKTGAKVVTHAKYSPHFKPGKNLRERIDASRVNTPIKEEGELPDVFGGE